MKLRTLSLLAALLCVAPFTFAGYGSENPRLEKLYSGFISPCCWQENLTVHDSPVARQLRAEIATMVQSGRSDDEIKAEFVQRYGKRVLALPEGSARIWLFWTPPAAALAGFVVVLLWLRRLVVQPGVPAPDRTSGGIA